MVEETQPTDGPGCCSESSSLALGRSDDGRDSLGRRGGVGRAAHGPTRVVARWGRRGSHPVELECTSQEEGRVSCEPGGQRSLVTRLLFANANDSCTIRSGGCVAIFRFSKRQRPLLSESFRDGILEEMQAGSRGIACLEAAGLGGHQLTPDLDAGAC